MEHSRASGSQGKVRTDQHSEAYYNQPALWELDRYDTDATQRLRARVIASLVDPCIERILDVGCGNGFVTRHLRARVAVVGLDASEVALAEFEGIRVAASCDHLPFPDRSFDAAVCAEVLEHLPPAVLARTVKELARVATTWLVIGVPFSEDLRQNMATCSGCGHHYHVYLHRHSFGSPADVLRLFPEWVQASLVFVGTCDQTRTWLFRRVRWALLGPHAATPLARCPRCGSAETVSYGEGLHRPMCRRIAEGIVWRLPKRTCARWMILALRRRCQQGENLCSTVSAIGQSVSDEVGHHES